MSEIIVLPACRAEIQETPWGSLTWHASGKLGNSGDMTTGLCRIHPGCENPRHAHPNCTEVLTVLEGAIVHTYGNGGVEMHPGDTITVPPNVFHNARNIGDTEAVMAIAFSSADRQMVAE